MSRVGAIAPHHKRRVFDLPKGLREVTARCNCGSVEPHVIESNMTFASALADVECLWCGCEGPWTRVTT